ncbi:MAG TPA: YegP family protein [Pyrinomonadaceae bacterium]|nr:YegP family protein [Pyrinomonadaceae bacterium]HNU07352.1 YegP family protein [Pyrinomonadaceae bacterium]
MAGKFEIKQSANGKFHFNLKAGNGQIILSSEMYESKSACQNGIDSVKKNGGDAARFEKRASANGDPYFIIKAGNGQEIGRSEMYSGDAACQNGIDSVMTNAPDAEVVDTTGA